VTEPLSQTNLYRETTLKTKLTTVAALAAAGVLVLAGCAAESSDSTPTQTGATNSGDQGSEAAALSGNILIDGSSTVGPASEIAAELFMEVNPGVRIAVNISGTGGGFEKFCNGETDASNASRFIKDAEAARCAENGIAFDFVTVANDALSVVVNKDNPLQCISTEQLAAIWNADASGVINNWGDVPGMPAAIASVPIQAYGPGADSGTFDFFTEAINGESGNIRNDYINIGEDDLAAVNGVAGGLGAIGFIPFSYYQESLDKVKALAVDGGSGCIEPSIENVQNLSYAPLGRGLFTYFSNTALARPEVLAFAQFLVNETQLINTTAGFVGLTPAQQAEQLARIDELVK
jgi:phosphate transport system substrate-binding protein